MFLSAVPSLCSLFHDVLLLPSPAKGPLSMIIALFVLIQYQRETNRQKTDGLRFSKFSAGSLSLNSPMPLAPGWALIWLRRRQTALKSFIRRRIRQGYCSPDINLADIIDRPTSHDNLFHQVLNDPNHVLAHLLSNRTSSQYNLRTRQHDRQLIPKMSKIFDKQFYCSYAVQRCILTLLLSLLYLTFNVLFFILVCS